jgi:hypothetical protein
VLAKDIRSGDQFRYTRDGKLYDILALSDAEPHTDITGLPVIKFMAQTRIDNTFRQGLMVFGGNVELGD